MKKTKAVILLSGGLDSSTTLYYAKNKGYKCHALIFDYSQKHKREIKAAISIAKKYNTPFELIKIKFPWKGSSLLDNKLEIPRSRDTNQMSSIIPSTYVPARNLVFLSFALSYAEAIGAKYIFIGANIVDYSGYPDCRPQFLKAFEHVIEKGARDNDIRLKAPLIKMRKEQILRLAVKLGVPVNLTWSCYNGGKQPCGVCDSCIIRKKAFDKTGIKSI